MLSRIVLFCGVLTLAGTAILLAGCGSGGPATGSGKETVVAAFYPLAFAAEQIAGGTRRREEPDAGRSRAARPRADPG